MLVPLINGRYHTIFSKNNIINGRRDFLVIICCFVKISEHISKILRGQVDCRSVSSSKIAISNFSNHGNRYSNVDKASSETRVYLGQTDPGRRWSKLDWNGRPKQVQPVRFSFDHKAASLQRRWRRSYCLGWLWCEVQPSKKTVFKYWT